MKRQAGFTLIEVMMVVAIIAILAVIALPAYDEYLIRSRIPEAAGALATRNAQMEQFFQDNRTYVAGPAGDAAQTANFDLSASFGADCQGNADTRSATGYTLCARGRAGTRVAGFTFSINQQGTRASTVNNGPAGWTGNATCWVTKKGGVC